MDHSELGGPFNGFGFKFVEPSEYDAVLDFLEKHLYPCFIPMGYKEEEAEDWNVFFRTMLENGSNLSYMMTHLESGEIAGVRMNDLFEKDHPHDPPKMKHKRNMNIVKVVDEISKEGNIFGNYGVTQYADMFGLCVHPKFRQMDIASESYRRGLTFLKGRGFDIVKCGFVSPYSRRAAMKSGYKEFGRRHFHECKDEEGNILNPDSDNEQFICLGVFDLRDNK